MSTEPVSPWPMLLALARPHRWAIAGYGLVLTAATTVSLVGPLLLGVFVDRTASGQSVHALVPIGIAYAALGFVAAGVRVLVTWRTTTLAWKITNGARLQLARQVLGADRAYLRDHPVGELVSRIDGDVSSLTTLLTILGSLVMTIAFTGIGGVAVLALRAAWLAPLLAVIVASTFWFVWSHRNAAVDEAEAERDAEADLLSVVEERLGGADDLAALGAGHVAVAKTAAAANQVALTSNRRMRAQMTVIGWLKTLVYSGEALMVVGGGLLFARGHITVGTVLVGYRIAGITTGPVEVLGWRLSELAGAGGSARRIAELLAHPMPQFGTSSLPPGPLDISLVSVGLTYDDGDADVLTEVSLSVGAGRRLGLVGRTGSGKTSIARLLLRQVPATRGFVGIGGCDVLSIDEVDFRARVGAVPQEVQLFPGSVRDNVALFDDSVSDSVVLRALAEVGLSDWLEGQTDGLQAKLGTDDGVGLSAGEGQLLALARLFCRTPSVLVLDEATSRIDPVTQAHLEAATERLLADRTAVIIAHRLSTLDRCDDIAVIDRGRVVEFGARSVLAADPESRFARLLAAGAESEELV